MPMSDKQARKLFLDTVASLTNVPMKQRDRIVKSLDHKLQDDMCLSMLLHAVECYTWNDYYVLAAKREADRQAQQLLESARRQDMERYSSLCQKEGYHA